MKINLLLLGVLLSFTMESQNEKVTIKKDTVITDTLSYALGNLLGASLKSQGFNELNLDDLNKGILHQIVNMSNIELQECDKIVQTYMKNKKANEYGSIKADGEKFLAENVKKPAIHVTPSGLQYEIITEGTGKKAGPADSVTVHYEGKLIDGTIFDSSIKRGQPIILMTNQVIAGWTEALQLMKEGSKYMLYIPYDLGYGEQGAGQAIPPFAALIFEVQLIKVGSK